LVDWDDFKFVQAVARAGSVRGAGEQLQVHPSTVTRHLEQLEQRLATRLFSRTRSGMEITPAGAAVIEALDRVAAELEQVERRLQARGGELSGAVRLAAPVPLATHLLVPGLDGFLRSYPDIELAVDTAPALEQLQRGQADLALALTDDPPGDLVGRALGPVMGCVYGAGRYLSAASQRTGALTGRWVGSSDPASVAGRVRARHFPEWQPLNWVDQDEVTLAALRSGLGIGLLPCYLGDSCPTLNRIPDQAPLPLGELWLLSRPESRGVARIQVLAEYLQRLFSGLGQRLIGAEATPASS
jgi:DNA-binding transcriptional LysR family regulator